MPLLPFGRPKAALVTAASTTAATTDPLPAAKSLDPHFHRRQSAAMDLMDRFHQKNEKRKSLNLTPRSSSAGKESPATPKAGAGKPATLQLDVESPPMVFYGSVDSSSGALFSGQLVFTVRETVPDFKVLAFQLRLFARVTTKKPVKDCAECRTKDTDIFVWNFVTEPTLFKKGTNKYPVSYLLPGHLPATASGRLGGQSYLFRATVTASTLSEPLILTHELPVYRAVAPAMDRTSIRLFPPLTLTSTVVLPPVIHPIGEFPVQFRLEGLISTAAPFLHHWAIHKLTCRIDEHSTLISHPCPKHAHKITGDNKGIQHTDTRTLSTATMHSGWKTDYSIAASTPAAGRAELEFQASIRADKNPICDVACPTGLSVTHSLTIELIVAEERALLKTPRQMVPTGAARVLRMTFALVLTERSGLGISWDEEQPPVYENVPESPPGYAIVDNYVGELPLAEGLQLGLSAAGGS